MIGEMKGPPLDLHAVLNGHKGPELHTAALSSRVLSWNTSRLP